MAYEVGASLGIRNAQHLTPLTLSAKLARIEMFFHILNIEREIYWQIGSITCAAYPLSQVDTIDVTTGTISHNSALNLVVFGEKDEHLELMDGILVDLLNAKWNTFVKSRFYRQFFLFCFYFLLSLISFTLRPGPSTSSITPTTTQPSNIIEEILTESPSIDENSNFSSTLEKIVPESPSINKNFNLSSTHEKMAPKSASMDKNSNFSLLLEKILAESLSSKLKCSSSTSKTFLDDLKRDIVSNVTLNLKKILPMKMEESFLEDNEEHLLENRTIISDDESAKEDIFEEDDTTLRVSLDNVTSSVKRSQGNWWDNLTKECRLMQLSTFLDKVRLAAETLMEIAAFFYIFAALREARFLGLNMFIENLMTAPSRVMFLFSCCILLTFPLLRFTCADQMEDMLAVVVMLTTAPYFLFFCRGFKTVGPFVVMIYRMIMGDLLRFVSIYLVFVMGFSQAYYIIFLSFDNPNTPEGIDDSVSNPMPSPAESIMAMFLMSMTNFGDYYGAFERTEHEMEGKLLFVLYMAIVAILLVNMLIAMMGNTYQKIAETRNEWQRQWARIVLVVERGVSPEERLKKLMDYSQPMSDGRRALVLRLNQTEEDKEEMKEILEMKRTHDRICKKRQKERAKESIITIE